MQAVKYSVGALLDFQCFEENSVVVNSQNIDSVSVRFRFNQIHQC